MNDEQRTCLGSVFRVTAEFLKDRGLTEHVLAQLPVASRALFEKPPFSFGWHAYQPLEEVEKILYARSPELAADLGRAAAQSFSGTIVAPMIELAVALFGSTPDGLFSNLDRFFSIVLRGFTFRYEPSGGRQGRVIATITGGAVHPSIFQQIKGNLSIAYELCRAKSGRVGEPEVLRSDAAGAEIALAVQWE